MNDQDIQDLLDTWSAAEFVNDVAAPGSVHARAFRGVGSIRGKRGGHA